jgi:hypothetical protein
VTEAGSRIGSGGTRAVMNTAVAIRIERWMDRRAICFRIAARNERMSRNRREPAPPATGVGTADEEYGNEHT